MRAWQSLRYKLPLLISALVGTVVVAVCWSGYHRIQDLLVRAEAGRLTSSTQRLADMLEASVRRIRYDAHRLAADSAITGFMRHPAPASERAAREHLEDERADATSPVAFALVDRDGTPLLTVGRVPSEGSSTVALPAPATRGTRATGSGAWVGPLSRDGDVVRYQITAPVLGTARDTIGYLLGYRHLSIGQGATQISGLIGPKASLLIGNAAGDVWTNLSDPVTGPSTSVPAGQASEYVAPDGLRWVGLTVPIQSTPWLAWVRVPRGSVLEPATHLILNFAGIALGLLALGALAAWGVSRQVTAPLAEISRAAEDLARGDYARRVPTTRRDELGSLARSFNSMATQVEAASRDLQAHAGDLEAANAELRESEQRYRQLVEILPDAILVHRDGRILLANPAAARLLGAAAPQELIGQSALDFAGPDERAELERRVRRAQDDRQLQQTVERSVRRLDGSTRVVEGASTPFTFDGQPVALTILHDVSDRKRLEERVRQSQKMEAVGQLAGGVAHDFNNLLTVITSYSGMLLAELPAGDAVRDDVQEIANAAERAAALTRQLLAFSRQQMLQPRVIDPNRTITDMEKMLRRVLPADIRLVTGLDPALGRVCVDPGQLEQVILNLVVNARDAMPDGGTLAIATANVELDGDTAALHAPAAAGGPYVTITVTDSGVGMTEEVRAHIFEPFFTTKESGRGTGLGLSTVYGIVTQSGGHIWCYSEPGRGTVFKVYLPQAEAQANRPSPAETAASTAGERATILLAEDEAPVRTVARRILERAGYTVLEAASGTEALRLCREHGVQIDLLLTDMMMPDLGGRELAERFRELYPEARTVFMSGYTEDAALRNGGSEVGTAFIQKPFTPQRLLRTLREALTGAAAGAAG